jgi:large subunit ribosomal protein LP0
MPLSKEKKSSYHEKMTRIISSYSKIFVVKVDNVGSKQMNETRKAMRGQAEILMGKNTLMRKILKDFMETNPGHMMAKLEDLIGGNVGFVFTNSDLPVIRDFILANRVPAPARPGAIAPVDVQIKSGPTGCDPGQTSFFQVLQIPTKIVKGQIEITSDVNLIQAGTKVGDSEAALLDKLNIKPFSYGLVIDQIFDNGAIFPVAILDIDDAVLSGAFSFACKKLAAVSLAVGYPTQASIPHSIGNGFKVLVSVTVGLENYTFPEAAKFKDFLANPEAFAASAAPTAVGGTEAAVAPVAPAEEEVDALEGGMDMFGGGGGGDY